MNYYQMILQYDGSDYLGFQTQEGMTTLQGDLNKALATILKGEFTTRAASRTDKGVHAFAQVIKISSLDSLPLDPNHLNAALISQMKCLSITECPSDFIPSMDQRSKEYLYLFSPHAQSERFIAEAPASLNLAAMRTCVEMLKGTHDFKNFWSICGVSNTTEREIYDSELTEIDPRSLFQGTLFTTQVSTCLQFKIHGRGFLKHMVRHLMGALWLVGNGTLTQKDFENYLNGELRPQRPWKKADPKGLFLVKVHYSLN